MPQTTNPIAKSWLTGEFWASIAAGGVICLIATNVIGATDHVVADAITDLFVKAGVGIGAMVTLASIAINMVTQRTSLKTTMLEEGLITEEVPSELPAVETPPAEVAPAV